MTTVNQLCNIAKKFSNFCTSLVGLGEHLQIVEVEKEVDAYILRKRSELNQKEQKKQELKGLIQAKKNQIT